MTDRPQSATKAVSVAMNSGAGISAAMGVAAPVGAVSRKDRQRASRTALLREGSTLVLHTSLRGTVTLQRRASDGDWETVSKRSASLLGRTRVELPDPARFRVVFAPRNGNLGIWVSEELQA